jgi:transglutaminase-like putative cysteine protease
VTAPTHPSLPVRHVSCRLEFEVADTAEVAVQVAAAATPQHLRHEQLNVTINGEPPCERPTEIATARGGRAHIVHATAGLLEVQYSATITSMAVELPAATLAQAAPVFDDETIAALRQSRYCPSDTLAGYAAVEFAGIPRGPDLAVEIASWVFERLAYEPNSSGPLDTAIDTLVSNAGVCRDFAHLTIALCRALGVPARLVAVYAPGLSPMDFHAVVETRLGTEWEVLDPTRLAPRSSLVRIATGRDAADTAFATTLQGEVEWTSSEITAVVDGDLPADDHRVRIALP